MSKDEERKVKRLKGSEVGDGDTGTITVKWIKIVDKPDDPEGKKVYFKGDDSGTPKYGFFLLTNATVGMANTLVQKLSDGTQATITPDSTSTDSISHSFSDGWSYNGEPETIIKSSQKQHIKISNVT